MFGKDDLLDYHDDLALLGKPVDRKKWTMEPQTVNAVNLPLQNALSFPAAILQPPFFDAQAPDAVNYGAIGTVIGHEISHTFDTEGSAFDSKGRVRDWWTAADLAHFDAATARLAAQYDLYKPFPDISVNGKQTLAENIADVAGVSAAYDGYRAALRGKTAPRCRIAGSAGISNFSHCVRAELGIEIARSSAAPTSDDRSTCACTISRGHGAEYRCLV